MKVLPIWYDHSSRKSILTYWEAQDCTPEGPQSIIELCKGLGLKQCYGVSNNFHTFLEAWKGCKAAGIEFRFGLEIWLCDDAKVHTEESRRNEHKVIVFAKNSAAYKDLIKLFSACHADQTNKYYIQRFDCRQLKQYWTENLMLALPFFDSFLHANTLRHGASIIPDFPAKPVIFREQGSGIPFAGLIDAALDVYNVDGGHEEVATKTIYYAKRADLDAYITYRVIQNRTSFNVPNLDFMCSPHFSVESWKELVA